ncbi:MAG TPA: monovalent cation/H+ antiporter subunit D family protein, partial [Candidatus Binatia bacterium]|nr:monovalent cation/H+ antiporter subunit D family protein [Candidatus Binatia bacterium]
WYLIGGALEGHAWLAVGVLLASSLLNLGYFVPIILAAFFRPLRDGEMLGEPSVLIVVPLVLTCLAGVVLGVAPNLGWGFLEMAASAARAILGGR